MLLVITPFCLFKQHSIKVKETAPLEINITRKRRKGRDAYGAGALIQRKPVKVLRMADYFKPSNATISALNMSGATTRADVEQSVKDQS